MGASTLLQLHNDVVRPEWIDYNDHMNLAYYVLIFDHATDAFLDYIGLDTAFREAKNCSTFAAEMHVNYKRELTVNAEVSVSTQLLAYDEKRIHYFHFMYDKADGGLVATNELMSLYMDMNERRVGHMPEEILSSLEDILSLHREVEKPPSMGRVINIPNT